jgi:hydrogenase maturation protease
MRPALVIGYGNPMRSDDGIGWVVAQEISRLEGITVMCLHQLTPDLAEDVSKAALVVFIDANTSMAPGEWSCDEVHPEAASAGSVTHHTSPARILELARSVYGAELPAYIVNIGCRSLAIGDTVSGEVLAVVPDIVNHVAGLFGEHIVA